VDDWANQFKSLLSSPLGAELIRELKENQHDTLISKAENAKEQGDAYGLLNKAAGITLAIEHLQMLAVVPKDEGSKTK